MSAALTRRASAAFCSAFGGAPDLIARAPGRVNLIGEHTDYNDGFALPCAIGVETQIAVKSRHDGMVRIVAADWDGARDEFRAGADIAKSPLSWPNYTRGVVREMVRAGFAFGGMDAAIAGDIPQGAGLSSSASLEIALALAIAALAGTPDADRMRIARIAQRAENEFVGCKSGLLDQFASAFGAASSALLIDFRTFTLTPAPMPADAAILIVHSGVTRALVDGRYNQRRESCERAAERLGVTALRDIDEASLAARKVSLDPVDFRRARHVVSENRRTQAAASAVEAGDFEALGRLMAQSHASMRDDFEITTPEINDLVERLQRRIGPFGGARMTGGGFGGCAVALLPRASAARVKAEIERDYVRPDGLAPLVLLERPAPGASLLV